MAEITRIKKSKFINDVIEKYTENRVGQFSKYLDTDPIFVTYYSVNLAQSRADLGTDSISDVLGSQSPIRYNKIEEFPIYIRSGLEPEINAEDGMISNEMELSDITILPMTITPTPFDHIYLKLPNMVPILLRVNSFRNLTIQSNDFYSASAHAIEFGTNDLKSLERLVVENYKCVYENIGTQNSCFIRSDMYDKSQALSEVIDELKGIYNSLYFDAETNSYIFNQSFYNDPMLVDPSFDYRQRDLVSRYGVHPGLAEQAVIMDMNYRRKFHVFAFNPQDSINPNIRSQTIYDLYLTKFIMDSKIFFTGDNYDSTSAVVYEDLIPLTFEADFKRTLWYAVMSKSTRLLVTTPYFLVTPIRKQMSALLLSRYPSPMSVTLNIKFRERHLCGLEEYFSHELLEDIKNGRNDTDSDCKCICGFNEIVGINVKDIIESKSEDFNKKKPTLKPYMFVKQEEDTPADETELTEADTIVKALNDIIYGYFNDTLGEIDTDQLISCLAEPSFLMYEYAPIIIYILIQKYNDYFVRLT